MKFVTTVVVRSGPPGYCDSDYEYFCTDEYPTECELDEFERETCSKYNIFHVRSVEWFVEVVGKECDEAAANCAKNAVNQISKAALGREQRP